MTDLLPNVPHSLKTRRAWVCWRLETRDGKSTKVPINPMTGTPAKSNDASTWTDFETACERSADFSGLGIMFDNGLCGVDLDKCRDADTGAVQPWAQEIVGTLDSYTEASPSGTGLHLLMWGELPPGGRRKGNIEMYDSGSPRYFTVTGQHQQGTATSVEYRQKQLETCHRQVFGAEAPKANRRAHRGVGSTDFADIDILAKARGAKNGADFTRLWDGGYPEDDSAGDLSLCNHLAFWTGGDEARMDELFRHSGRMRPKWDERRGAQTYGELTLGKALEQTTDFYSPCGKRKTTSAKAGAIDPRSALDEEALTTVRLATAMLETESFAKDEGSSLYFYDAGYYHPKGPHRIKARVKSLMQDWQCSDKWSSHKQDEVVKYIQADPPSLQLSPPLGLLNLRNGLLDLSTAQLLPHTPGFLSVVQLPVAYDPDATCPAWTRFVEQTFPEDTQDLPWEIVAWLMTADTSMQKAVLLLGEGANGKSVFLAGVTAFLGLRNCANLSLHKLEADRFAPARLLGKLANICPDLPAAHLVGTSMLKAITGGDSIDAERKYAEGFSFTPFARLIFSANHPPQSPDASHAFFRRWLCVPFTRTFEGAAARPRGELDAELAAPEELSGLLNMALAALPRVKQHGVAETASMKEAWSEFRTVTDPLAVWLDRETLAEPTAVITKERLWKAYNAACERTGRPVTTSQSFGAALKRLRPDLQEAQRTEGGRKMWSWLGLGLRSGQEEH